MKDKKIEKTVKSPKEVGKAKQELLRACYDMVADLVNVSGPGKATSISMSITNSHGSCSVSREL